MIRLYCEGVRLPRGGVSRRMLSRWLGRIGDALGIADKKISVILTGDDAIHAINKRYRGKDRPTDVISFAYGESPAPIGHKGQGAFGDVFISLDRCRAQSLEYSVGFREELARLVVHGLCHLAGYDHERGGKKAAAMRRREEEMIALISPRSSRRGRS